MRIIAGRFKGTRLRVPRSDVRPTSDRLRGSLISALGEKVLHGSVWLDAFAGTGAVGIEAMSRGAEHVVFNDRDRVAYQVVRGNLENCGIETGFTLVKMDAFVLLRDPPSSLRENTATVLFLDPPYGFARYGKLLRKALDSPLVDRDTLVILEIFKKTDVDFIPDEFVVKRTLRSGDSHLLLLSHG